MLIVFVPIVVFVFVLFAASNLVRRGIILKEYALNDPSTHMISAAGMILFL